MDQSELLDLVGYTEWATARLTAALRLIPDAERRRRDDSAFGSLHGTFAHLIAAEWVWLERSGSRSRASMGSSSTCASSSRNAVVCSAHSTPRHSPDR
ncbi:MAG: hypothetical protein K8S21_00480 [Gemmatimonadetes bacterium]|nr:hypothetical protein [Gemmatimonadota bacterium]